MTFWERTATNKTNLKTEGDKPTLEDRNWEHALFSKTLSDEFTDRVMLALEEIEIESVDENNASARDTSGYPASEQTAPRVVRDLAEPDKPSDRRQYRKVDPYDTSIASQIQRGRAAKLSSHLKVWGASAAAVVLVGSTLLYTQPTLADVVRSLFAKDSYVDSGMKMVQEAGGVQISGASAEDQGYILKVNEVIADSTRLIIGIDVYDAKGNAFVGDIDSTTADFRIFDNQRGDFGDVSFGMSTGGNQTTNRIEFNFMRPILTDKLQLSAHINELRLYTSKLNVEPPIKTIKGDWSLRMEADLTVAKAQTLITPIDTTYETPGGVRIHMQGATRTPSGGSLEFTTALTADAAARAVNGQSGFHKLNYHLEDAEGNRLGDSLRLEFGRRSELNRWSGVTQWFYPFNNFAYDKQQIRFVLDSYVIRENSDVSVVLDPAQASAEHPVKFEDSGDMYLLEGLHIGPYPKAGTDDAASDQVFATIPIKGTFNNPDFHGDTWIAIDEKGKEYSMSMGGSVISDQSGLVESPDALFVINALETMPKQLTLKRLIVNHQYKDANWSFVIPQTGTKGVIP